MYEFGIPEEHHSDIPLSPNILFSLAIGIVGDAASAMADDAEDGDLRGRDVESIRFAASFFDSYIDTKFDDELATEFALLGAASYYLADMPGNARLLASSFASINLKGTQGLDWLTHRLLSSSFDVSPEERESRPEQAELLDALEGFFSARAEADEVFQHTRRFRRAAYDGGDGRAVLYADLVAAISVKKVQCSARLRLPEASGLPQAQWLEALRKPGFVRELWPAQVRICDEGLLRGRSAVVQMPTSAGKTRATELIIRSTFLSGRTSLAVIVCPFRALCHDVRRDLASAFAGENIGINEATDAFQLDLTIEDLFARRSVLIVTPEKLLYILRREPGLADQIGLVIYDEGHQFDSPSRGVSYELLLTSLKLLLRDASQTILLSAVISNAASVAGWLVGDDGAVVSGADLAPTSRSVAFASWATRLGQLQYVSPVDPDDPAFFVPRVIERVNLGRRGRERSDRFFPPNASGPSIGLYLGLKAVRNGSVALFCGRKDTAAGICDAAVEIFSRGYDVAPPRALSNEAEVARLANLFADEIGQGAGATQSATLGIFPHHTNVPNGLKLAVEYAMKEGLARFVVCTSTLAQGVNLPIRYLIVTGVYQGSDRILVRDFHNLIGRAGRAGMHTEGSVIFAQSQVYDQRLNPQERWRWNTAKSLLNPQNAEPTASSILWLFEPFRFGRFPVMAVALEVVSLFDLAFEDIEEIDRLVAQFEASHPGADASAFRGFLRVRSHIVQAIASFLLAHLDFESASLLDDAGLICSNTLAFHLATEEQREELQELFRRIASYVQLQAPTQDLRDHIRRAPLAPRAVRSLQAWVAANVPALQIAQLLGNLLQALISKVIEHSTNEMLLSFTDREAILPMSEMWIAGQPFANIHGMLRDRNVRITSARRRPKVDDVVGICESAFGYDGAMLLSTIADLVAQHDEDLVDDISFLHKRMKYGLPSRAAIIFFELGFADRVVSTQLAELFNEVENRGTAIRTLRGQPQPARELLNRYPSYFTAVLNEVIAA